MNKRIRKFIRSPHGWLIIALSAAIVVLSAICVVELFENSGKLGSFFVPALLVLLAVPTAVLAWLYRRRELQMLRAELGEARFYQAFPKERKRDERRLGHPISLQEPEQQSYQARQAELLEKHIGYCLEKQERNAKQ